MGFKIIYRYYFKSEDVEITMGDVTETLEIVSKPVQTRMVGTDLILDVPTSIVQKKQVKPS